MHEIIRIAKIHVFLDWLAANYCFGTPGILVDIIMRVYETKQGTKQSVLFVFVIQVTLYV